MLKNKKLLIFIALFNACLYADVSPTHWGYGDEDGPKKWGDLDPSYRLCKEGKKQTPINIITKDTQKTKNNLKFEYNNTTNNIVNNGHSIQINVDDGNIITFDNTQYKLIQFHFHTYSENKINGRVYPLELHLVHQNDDGKFLVVSVLFDNGDENKAIQKIINNLPESIDKPNEFKDFKIDDLLPKSRGYYEFIGSLTTPPCTEDVQWIVMKEQPKISQQQFDRLKEILHFDARDIQPLNDRIVKSTED